MNDDSIDLAKEFHLDFICLDAWCVVPDVFKSHLREVAAPVSGNEASKQCAEDGVAKFQPKVEAFVCQLPYTVNGMYGIRLTKDLLKADLDKIKIKIDISDLDKTHR